MRLGKLVALAGVLVACSSTTPSSPSGQDGATVSGGTVGSGGAKSAGGATSNGGASANGGATASGGAIATGGAAGSGGVSSSGGTGSNGGVTGTGGGKGDAAADLRSDLAVGSGGASNTGGTAGGNGGSGTGGAGNGGASGTLADGGRDSGSGAKPDLLSDATKDGVASTDGFTKPVAVPDGGTCPYTGHVTYKLTKSANPTAAEQTAYAKITAAMDQAISYYNCYTNITKADNVVYDPSVETADGNSNGTIHFGSNTTYMVLPTAMHEISHTVGIGQAANWHSFVAMTDAGSGPWTGANGIAQRQALLPDDYNDQQVLTADTQHFWPYGLNYASEYKSEADLLGHCAIVMALRKDMGL